jgi:hypothetical protein
LVSPDATTKTPKTNSSLLYRRFRGPSADSLSQEIFDDRVIGVNNDLLVHDVRSEIFKGEYYR